MGLQRRLISRIPAGIRTQSSDCMLVALGLPAGLVTLAGQAQSRALDMLLPWLMVKLWALALIIGCLAWICGLTGVRLQDDVLVLTRVACYRFGLHLLAVAGVVYAAAILILAGWNGVIAAWPVLAFAAATYLKAADLDRILRRSRGPG